jgi:hypothetical protein
VSAALTAEQSRMCATLEPMIERFARRLADRYPAVGYAELRSAGNEGAVKCVLSYTPDRGTLDAYASAWIWNEMRSAARKTTTVWRREGFRPAVAHEVGAAGGTGETERREGTAPTPARARPKRAQPRAACCAAASSAATISASAGSAKRVDRQTASEAAARMARTQSPRPCDAVSMTRRSPSHGR